MTKRWKRIKVTLAILLGVIACSTLAPAPLRGHWIDPLYWSVGRDPVFITFVSGKEIAFFGRDPAFILGRYSRRGVIYCVDEYRAKCTATVYPTPLFAYYYRPEMKDFFVLTRDWRWWMPHPSLNEADKMQLDETLEANRVAPNDP
jgi:hypothetical protein